MPDYLNIFHPYERKGAGHEDALTRAFLLVLRSVPVAHAAWLHLVDRAHRKNGGGGIPQLHELGAPNVDMQASRIPDAVTRVVSLVLTDEHVPVPTNAEGSDRQQVLDGVVSYDELAIVVENKPWHGNIWEGQLHVNISQKVKHDPHVACVVWRDIVVSWGQLLDSRHLNSAEVVLIGDFLEYVEQHFPALRPYSRVALCGTSHSRLTQRCKAALVDIAGTEFVKYHQGWGWYIDLSGGQCARKIGLLPELNQIKPQLVLEIDPADTMGQARILYGSVRREDVEELLTQPRWNGWPNFHLMFMTSGFFKVGHRHTVADYWTRWAGNPKLIKQWRQTEFDAAFAALLELDMLTETNRDEFDRHTKLTNRDNVCFAPGLTLQWQLPLDEAALLDQRGQLETELRKEIELGARALRLRLPWHGSESSTH